ncbi:MAG: hypothetical protein EMLJLAPB_01266 [Candidatus Argoarchaeum ethanivorans]|uniref:Uncharacterized protein n=1 Tax=Candidatus Argoarchaeum ethanivorans TaxID=2608793 RepID=A0A811THB0_9EURY|nr:MAG: hypothetical protein EMLJLAPB_01266 [Candidatus Argoarchaeum ethanivorans]
MLFKNVLAILASCPCGSIPANSSTSSLLVELANLLLKSAKGKTTEDA